MKNLNLSTFLATVALLFACMTPALLKAQEQTVTPTFASSNEIMSENSYVADLALNLKPTIFINESDRFLYKDHSFLVVECVPSQISQLYAEDDIFSSVQLIKIKIDENAGAITLNLALLQSFSQLQFVQLVYVYDACSNGNDDCLLDKAQNSVLPGYEQITVIYTLSFSQE